MDRLPRDILQLIAEKISHHKDVLRVAAVCKKWRSVIMDNLHLLPPRYPLCLCLPSEQRPPLLMQCHNGDEEGTIDFLSVFNNKSYNGFLLPEISRKWIAGSSNGWLFVIEMDGGKIQLLNPLTRAQIPLPSLSTFDRPDPEYDPDTIAFIDKIVMSGDPKKSSDCIVMAIISLKSVLSFCRLGDDKWTNIERCPLCIRDVIPCRGRFYAITSRGSVVACDATRDGNVEVIVVGAGACGKRYLLESTSGDLLQVERVESEESPGTEFFAVYKLEAVDGAKNNAGTHLNFERLYANDDKLVTTEEVTGFQWVELESLGDQALFLGHNTSLALSADSVPGCRRNCICCTDDFNDLHMWYALGIGNGKDETEDEDGYGKAPELYYDMGFYDMEDEKIEPFGELKDKTFALPPIWVLPKPW